ncbi:hypothetical protein H632_c4029p0, partial [Helicosporidium sp. ATCC 50920]
HCWLQCPDARAAAQLLGARGVRIPASVLGPEAHPPVVEGFFATGLPVLGVMKQSLCARDLEDASLPWGEPDWGFLQALPVPPQALQADSGGAGAAGTVGAPPAGSQTVVCATFDNQVYPVTVEGLHTVFSTYGTVERVTVYDRDSITAYVQYSSASAADNARAALEGHAMYDGGYNVMHVSKARAHHLVLRPGDHCVDYTRDAKGVELNVDRAPPVAAVPSGQQPPY